MIDWANSSVLVTGGTGSFGKKFVDVMLRDFHPRRLVVFSRDELKQHEMRVAGYDHPSLRYFIGDVRDRDRLERALNGIDIVVHAAAMKQVEACEYNPIEAIQTNVMGTRAVIEAAIDAKVSRGLFIGTDKAVNPANLYGATKLCGEKLWVESNAYAGERETRFSCVRYGNVVGSRGSVIPLFLKQRDEGRITVTDDRMTRFWITLEQGVRFVIDCIERMRGGEVFVPKIPSMKLVDLAAVIAPGASIETIGIRPRGARLRARGAACRRARRPVRHQAALLLVGQRPGRGNAAGRRLSLRERLERRLARRARARAPGRIGDVSTARLALDGGEPVRSSVLPYGRQAIDDEDVQAVADVLRSDWLTTGPAVPSFEQAFAGVVGAAEAVAVSNGTAALHAAAYAVGVSAGDEVVVPALTFASTANCAVFLGATPVFADVDEATLLVDPASVADRLTGRTKAVIAVDYAGQPCDYDALRSVGDFALVADASHAIGGSDHGRPVGTLADATTFSLHPVKQVTTGEGGVVTSMDPEVAQRVRLFRNHGITTDHRQRDEQGSWFYEMVDLGFNYRLTDIQAALGESQLRKLPWFLERRRAIARRYDEAIGAIDGVQPVATRSGVEHGYHLYVVQLELDRLSADRGTIFAAMRAEGIGVNVHYIPVHLHPYYRERFGTGPGLCPVAEAAYERSLTLPLFPAMTDGDAGDVLRALEKVIEHYLCA
jgi:perosamine synthetase